MPSASSYLSNHRATRGLIVGDPGAGKSTACALLATSPAINRIFVLDLDDNWRGPLRQLDPSNLSKIRIETLKDPIRFDVAKKYLPVVKGVPQAFPGVARLLNDWTDTETGESFGPPETWSSSDVLVIDGCSGLASVAMFYTLYANGRMGQMRRKKDWGNAIERFEGVMQSINEGLPCHVLCTAHLARLTPESEPDDDEEGGQGKKSGYTSGGLTAPENFWMRYPSALGQKLPPRLGGLFEFVVQAKRVGVGMAARRVLKTTPDDDVDVKLPLRQGEIKGLEIANDKLIDILTKATHIE